MDFIKIEWVSCQQIKARHSQLPTKQTASIQYQLYINNHRPFIHVFRTKKGELLLYRGLEAYNTYLTIHPSQMIPVYIVDIPMLSQLDWTCKLLQSCLKENVHYKLKREYIMLLLRETKHNLPIISEKTGYSTKEILPYIIDETVPDKYQELAIQYNRQHIVNEISRNPKLRGYKTLLYRAVFQEKNRLTYDKLKLFLKFLEAGHQLNVDSILSLPNLNRIVDLNQALHFYWNNLDIPNSSILEGLFYYKGKKDSQIRVKL